MEKEQMLRYGADMIYLASLALHGIAPSENFLAKTHIPSVAKMAAWHSMQGIVYMALSPFAESLSELDSIAYAKLKRDYGRALKKIVLFDIEREQLCEFFESNGISHLLLKGTVLQHYYPRIGMRQMADNDILIDASAHEAVREYMESRGYVVETYGKGCHDTYIRGDLNFEIHRKLVSDTKANRGYSEYFGKTFERCIPSNTAQRQLSDEDFYIYYIYHAYKHFSGGGTGVRTLMDIEVFKSKKGDALDWAYIERELALLGLLDYERRASSLANKIFSERCVHPLASGLLSNAEIDELIYYVSSGTFGTVRNMVDNSLDKIAGERGVTLGTKTQYLLGRIFPPYEHYKQQFPKASRCVLLLPLLWIARLVRAILAPDKFTPELRELRRINKDKRKNEASDK